MDEMAKPRILNIETKGTWAMICEWVKRGHVFRARWSYAKGGYMTIFRPFIGSAYRAALKPSRGGSYGTPAALLDALDRDGKDDLDLFLHEVAWHGISGERLHAAEGIGAKDMVVRARTTKQEQRNLMAGLVLGSYDVVVLHD